MESKRVADGAIADIDGWSLEAREMESGAEKQSRGELEIDGKRYQEMEIDRDSAIQSMK